MKIETISNQLRNDLYGFLKCEGCGASQKFVGYDDYNWHQRVLPSIKCASCGKSSVMCNSVAEAS